MPPSPPLSTPADAVGADASISSHLLGPRRSLIRDTLALVGQLAFALAMLEWPYALLARQSFGEQILHAAPLKIVAGLFVAAMSARLVLFGTRPRDPAHRRPLRAMWRVCAVWYLLGAAAILAAIVPSYRLAATLDAHGVPTEAQLLRQFTVDCGKTGFCTEGLYYRFIPAGQATPVTGYVETAQGKFERGTARDYVAATGKVPIIYDPAAPHRAMLYWNDEVHRAASPTGAIEKAGLLVALMTVVLGGLAWRCLGSATRGEDEPM